MRVLLLQLLLYLHPPVSRSLDRVRALGPNARCTDDVLGSFLDEMVTKDERRDVARRMKANWRRVGDILGPNPMFQSYDLNSFEEKRNNQDRAQAMLDAWSQKHLKKATRRVLIRALKEEGYGTLIRDVFKWDPDDVSPLPSEHTNRAR